MLNNKKLQFSISVYLFVYLNVLIAIVGIYYTFVTFKLTHSLTELIIVTFLLLILRRWPIQYFINESIYIRLAFSFPILVIYGIVPIIISEIFFLLFFKLDNKKALLIKKTYNVSNKIISALVAYNIFQFTIERYLVNNIFYIPYIIFGAMIYSIFNTLSVKFIVFLERKQISNNTLTKNIFVSNIMNGIITFFLYQSLGIIGIFLAVLYAILFSKRSTYQAAYSKKNMELYELEQKAKMIFDTIDYGVVMLDKEQRIKMANPVATQCLLQFDPNPIGKIVTEFEDILPTEIIEILEWTYQNQNSYQRTNIAMKVKDETLYSDLYTYPQRTAEGEMTAAILLFKDVNNEHQIRQQLIEADKLNHLGQIAAGKVHEIKNPLTVVRGYLQLLQKKVEKDDVELNYFDIALQEIDRTNEIINSLLILAKQTNQEPSKIQIDSILKTSLQLFENQLLIENITYKASIEDKLTIIGVENQIKQIFMNLFLNAIAAVSAVKGALIEVRAYTDSSFITIEIKDNGIGIEAEDIKKLGVPFYTTKEDGTGLGISVTYKLIKEHQGTVEVESTVREGTVFKIAFPKAST